MWGPIYPRATLLTPDQLSSVRAAVVEPYMSGKRRPNSEESNWCWKSHHAMVSRVFLSCRQRVVTAAALHPLSRRTFSASYPPSSNLDNIGSSRRSRIFVSSSHDPYFNLSLEDWYVLMLCCSVMGVSTQGMILMSPVTGYSDHRTQNHMSSSFIAIPPVSSLDATRSVSSRKRK